MVSASHSERVTTATPPQQAARVIGAVFLLVGVLGFVPGVVSNYSSMSFMGHDSTAKLLGIFEVSVLHNIVHVLLGVAGLAMARTKPRQFLVGGGVIYLVLWVYGIVIDKASTANFVPVNTADNWLHFALGAAMLALGMMLSTRPHRP